MSPKKSETIPAKKKNNIFMSRYFILLNILLILLQSNSLANNSSCIHSSIIELDNEELIQAYRNAIGERVYIYNSYYYADKSYLLKILIGYDKNGIIELDNKQRYENIARYISSVKKGIIYRSIILEDFYAGLIDGIKSDERRMIYLTKIKRIYDVDIIIFDSTKVKKNDNSEFGLSIFGIFKGLDMYPICHPDRNSRNLEKFLYLESWRNLTAAHSFALKYKYADVYFCMYDNFLNNYIRELICLLQLHINKCLREYINFGTP